MSIKDRTFKERWPLISKLDSKWVMVVVIAVFGTYGVWAMVFHSFPWPFGGLNPVPITYDEYVKQQQAQQLAPALMGGLFTLMSGWLGTRILMRRREVKKQIGRTTTAS